MAKHGIMLGTRPKSLTSSERVRLAKEVLKKHFPNNTFRIWTSPHGVMVIHTDLIKHPPNDLQEANWRVSTLHSRTDEDMHKSNLYQKMLKQNQEIWDKIKDILRKAGIREKYQTDQVTGEILQGGNFFINIRGLEDYKLVPKNLKRGN